MENKNTPKNPWKGPFYYDRKDSRVTIPRPNGVGFRVNFGHPLSWFFIAGFVFIICCAAWLKLR